MEHYWYLVLNLTLDYYYIINVVYIYNSICPEQIELKQYGNFQNLSISHLLSITQFTILYFIPIF